MSSAVALEPVLTPESAPAAAPSRVRPLPLLLATVFVDLVGFGIVIPLLPLYAQNFGAGPVAVGWLMAVYSLMQFAAAPLWGSLSDRWGRRPVLLLGLFGSAASYLLCGVAGSVTALLVARALAGTTGATVGVAQAYVADTRPAADRTGGMGLIGAAFGLGFILGPAIGGLLAGYGTRLPMLAAGALALLNALLALWLLPESLPPERRERGPMRSLLRPLLPGRGAPPARGARAALAASGLLTLAFAGLEGSLSLWAHHHLGLGPRGVAGLFVYLGVVSVLAHGRVAAWLSRRLHERWAAAAGSGMLAAGLAALALLPPGPASWGALALVALGQGTAGPALATLLSRSGPAAMRGQLLGRGQALAALARVAGPLGAGAGFAYVSWSAPFLAGAVMAAGGAAVLARGAET